MGSDSKVSWGTAPEDVAETEEDGRVQRVFEQDERGRLVIEAEPDIDAVPEGSPDRLEADFMLECPAVGAEAGGT